MSEEQQPIQGDLADSIAMLEQILEVMPHDAEALKAVYSAYAQNGHTKRALGYLSRLVDVVAGGNEPDVLAYVLRELPGFQEAYPSEVAAQAARLRILSGAREADSYPQVKVRTDDDQPLQGEKTDADISEELALAWRLYEEGQLSQEEYSSVLHDLTEVSSKELDVPVSVLHVLYDRGFTQMNRIINYLSSRSDVPFLSLSSFELGEREASALPLDFSIHDGALPFAFFGDDLLVGVLNPFNNMLVDKIEAASGGRCHTYLIEPADYDAALGKLKALVLAD